MPPKKTIEAAATSKKVVATKSKPKAATQATTDDNIANKYKKLEHRQHVLQKHGMYIGSIEKDQVDIWLVDAPGTRVEKRRIEYIPGLFKIFDEIVGNAIDHSIRQRDTTNPVKSIKVLIDKDTGVISVTNDGDGIEVVKHPEHDIYVPELIFGNLLTSTNYADDADNERIVQGTNGIGCKACNIFSSWFEIETIDGERGLKYKQRFEDNMSIIKKPSVTKSTVKKTYTTVSFLPDYGRFGLTKLSDDMYEVMRKRTYDACAVTDKGVAIHFNGTKLDVPTFEKYVDLYLGSKTDHTRVHELIDDRWEIVASYNDFGGFEQVSFVNGILTIKGGKHVDYIMGQIVKKITELVTKKHKDANIKPHTIKDNLIIFIKCTISNPTFDSQTKESLTTAASKFGSKPEVSAAFVTKLFKTGIEQRIMDLSAINDDKTLKKTDGKKSNTVRGIVKLEDAAWAGGPKSSQCTLILTEGDSAATMAIAGLAEVGRDRFGVFPLKGKVMNVKDATIKKISENEEINNIKKILGLESGKTYKNASELRYGQLMLMTDSDSVTGDTPLLLQNADNHHTEIATIAELGTKWTAVGSREYSTTPLKVWTEKGWTKIVHMMRHLTTKRLYRIVTPCGTVDVTEDHSLLDEHANMIRPGNCRIGQRLLHSFPKAQMFLNKQQHPPIPSADEIPPLVVRAPNYIMNGDENVRTKFLEALPKSSYTTTDKVRAMELYYLHTSVGHYVEIDVDEDGTHVLSVDASNTSASNTSTSDNNNNNNANATNATIRKIIDLGVTQQYVYDLETENHHFHAGVGELIVHNTDGSHIKGLVFNLFHSMWPSLVREPTSTFMTSMLTPIIKARRGTNETVSFYTLSDFEKWYVNNGKASPAWKIKYYKGLGTSTNAEAREYFKDMRQVTYKFDGDGSDKAMDLAFNKKLADDRKVWLSHYDKDDILDFTQQQVSYGDFVKKELIHFSNDDLERSLPSMCDGLKNSQRKIMYACFKRPSLATEEIKVAQLAGYVSETSAYHHGEASLQQAIVGLAQDFVGSNNLNLLQPKGQFGCLDPDVEVLLWSGKTIKAKDVVVGQQLVGDDGEPRTVLHTVKGVDEMYEIKNTSSYASAYASAYARSSSSSSSSYRVNSQHILTLYNCKTNQVEDVKLSTLLDIPDYASIYMGIKNNVPINWTDRQFAPIDAYMYASWLANAPENEATAGGIPDDYLFGDTNTRTKMLDGVFDTFGNDDNDTIMHNADMINAIEHLAGSLGRSFIRTSSTTINIYKKNNQPGNLYNISITPVGPGPFNGWQIDGNERFLLADWTVTHNSRAHGGHDASQPRYIYTQLAVQTPIMFSKDDMPILTYNVDDGQTVEPEFYVPIVPTILINGAIGIGTGFSTNIPCYNPTDIIRILKEACVKSAPSIDAANIKLDPWYRGFTGEIRSMTPGKYVSLAKWKRESETKVHITELPIGTWTHDYKELLEKLLDEMPNGEFKKYENRSSDKIDITLYFTAAALTNLMTSKDPNGFSKLENKFGLVSTKGLSTTNMNAFNTANQITKYAEPGDIMAEFYTVRLATYQKRKEHMLASLELNAKMLENKKRFIKGVVANTIPVTTLKKAELELLLAKSKPPFDKHEQDDNYDYLVRIPVYNLTKDKVEEIEAEVAAAKSAATKLRQKTIYSMWLADLEALEKKMPK